MIDGGSVTSWKESGETLVGEKALVAGDHDENAPTASTLRRADNTAIPKILRACLPLFPSPSRFILSFCFVIENRRTQFCVRELVVVVFCGRKRFRTALIHSILDFAENKWIKTKFFRYGVSGCMRQNGISCILGHWRFFATKFPFILQQIRTCAQIFWLFKCFTYLSQTKNSKENPRRSCWVTK